MTDDRAMLEAAARAAGISVYFDDVGQCCKRQPRDPLATWLWNPLTDDGDALRLAVKLSLLVKQDTMPDGPIVKVAIEWSSAFDPDYFFIEEVNRDPYAATRRAIVRAAAALAPPTA